MCIWHNRALKSDLYCIGTTRTSRLEKPHDIASPFSLNISFASAEMQYSVVVPFRYSVVNMSDYAATPFLALTCI